MGYESKIFVVDRSDWLREDDGHLYGRIVAMVDMSCCPGLSSLFTEPADVSIFADNENKSTCVDKYGDEIKSANIQNVIQWCEKQEKEEHYRRFNPLIGLLKGLNPDEWKNLMIVHYGH